MGYTPRTKAPAKGDKYFTNYQKGGLNTAIIIDKATGFCLPNCVGYAQGRFLENEKATAVNWKLPACNAEDWYATAQKNGLKTGSTPKIGAVIVWRKGKVNTSSDGAGHVAIVEKIAADGTITISESAYNSYTFKTETIKKPYDMGDLKLLGFIYPLTDFGTGDLGKAETQTKVETTDTSAAKTTTNTAFTLKTGAKVVLSKVKGYTSETIKNSYKTLSGTYYIWSATATNGRVKITNSADKVGVAGKVTCWVNVADLPQEWTVQVTSACLNIRKGAGTTYAIAGTITDKGKYIITEKKNNWGKLKDGRGWICLDYTKAC